VTRSTTTTTTKHGDNGRVRIAAGTRPAGHLAALTGPVGSVAAAAAAVAVIAVVDPNEPGHYPTCPFLALTGEFCPGCGSLRAMHALTRGDLAGAAGLNLLIVASLPMLAVIWSLWLRRSWSGAPGARPLPPALIWALAGGALLFGLVRNLPFGAGLAP
jgi:hypothetical protein